MHTATVTSSIARQFHIFSVLRCRDFRLFWSGLLVQVSGQMMMRFTIGWLAFDLTGSPLYLGYVALATAFPAVIMRLAGGVFADRLDRRYVITIAQSISLVIISGLAFLTLTDRVEIWHLMLASFLVGAAQSFDDPSRSAIFPHLLPDRSHLANAVPVFSSVWRVNQMSAPIIAGFLIAYGGAGTAFFVCAASFGVMAAVMPLLRVRGTPRTQSRNVVQDLKEGTGYVWRHPLFRVLTITNSFVAVFAVGHVHLLPVFAKEILHVDAIGLGILTAAQGVGAMAGVIAAPVLMRRFGAGKVLMRAMMAFGVSLIAFAFSPWYLLSLLLIGITGIASFAFLTAVEITVQTMVPDQLRGRVMSLLGMRYSLIPLGTFVLGAVANFTDIRLAVGGGALLVTLYALVVGASNRAVRDLGVMRPPAPRVAEAGVSSR